MNIDADPSPAPEVAHLQQRIAELEQQLTEQAAELHLFKALVDRVPDGIAAANMEGNIIYANEASRAMMGYGEALIGMSLHSLFAEDPAYISSLVQHTISHGCWQGVLTSRCQDGTTFHGQLSAAVIRDSSGHPQALAGVVRDVSEHSQAEAELRSNIRFLETLLDTIPNPVFYKDTRGNYRGCNHLFAEQIIGLPKAQIIGQTISSLSESIPPDLAEIYQEQDSLLLQRGGVQRYESQVQCADGTMRDFLFSKTTFDDPAGNIAGIVGVMLDITEQKNMELRLETALHKSQSLLQAIINHSPAAIAVKDTDWRMLLINDYGASTLNLDPEQAVGKREDDLLPPELIQQWRYYDEQVIATSIPVEIEEVYQLSDGPHTFLSMKFPLYDDQNEIYAIGIIATDITRRKQAETALLASEQRFRAIFEHAGIGIALATMHGQTLASNQALQRLLGYTDEELCRIPYVELTYHDDRAAEAALFKEMIAQQRNSYQIEKRYIRKDGMVVWCRLTVSLVLDGSSPPQLGIAMMEDISERKRAEEALTAAYRDMAAMNEHLRRSRDLLYTLFDGLDDGLLLLNSDGRVMLANQALAALLGRRVEDMVNQPWMTICSHFSPPFPGSIALHTLRDGHDRRRRERVTGPDGRMYVLDMQTLPLSGTQVVDQVVMHIVDMTERLQLETLVIESERFAASGKLAATVAHEVNTPLQAIRNFLYLAGNATDEQRATYLALARDEIARISTIVRQLLDLYRPDSSTIAPVNINVLIDRVMLLTGGTLNRHRITVERHLMAELPAVWGRADQLIQVLLNLIMNAIDAMSGGGSLCLRTTVSSVQPASDHLPASEAYLVIEVADNGKGINPELQERIFDPFFTTRADGTGLGLAISRKIIAQHDGIIRVQSAPNNGSTFTILLPFRQEMANAKEMKEMEE